MNDTSMELYLRDNLATYQACASHRTCDECLNASYFCHFCEFDFQCHAIGSPLGCAKGISQCHHLKDCLRSEPQYVGYGPPPSVVIAVLCLVITLTCCICGVMSICSVFLRRGCRRGTPPRDVKAKKEANDVEDATGSQEQPLLSAADENSELSFEDDMDAIALERLEAERNTRRRSSLWRKIWTRMLWVIALLALTILALMFYPRMPDYNVCNREFDWESILQSLRHLHPKINYDVLISVINENRFGFEVESGFADIYHNKTKVGKWELSKSWKAAPGAISDALTPVKLEPGYTEAYALLEDFRQNKLIFNLNASITGYITWGTYKLYRVTSAVSDIEFLVGAEYDRSLCKCTEYLTPK